MTEELIALLGGREIGRVHREAKARLSFTYGRGWREADEVCQRSGSEDTAV
jgi:serine/threonine-protein kinase HipA